MDEFKAMFGPDRNIVGAMAYSSTPNDGWTITVTAGDVLATEGANAMQRLIIDGLLAQIGMDPMEADEIGRRALGINQISLDAVLFLMEMRDQAETPQEADVITELCRPERGRPRNDPLLPVLSTQRDSQNTRVNTNQEGLDIA